MNNQEIDELARRGSSDPDIFYLAVMQLLAEIAKRLPETKKFSAQWVEDLDNNIMANKRTGNTESLKKEFGISVPLGQQGLKWNEVGQVMDLLGCEFQITSGHEKTVMTFSKARP